VLALDIGSQSVKIVAARRDASAVRVETVARAALPPGTLHGHVVRHHAPVAAAIRALIGSTIGRRRACVTMTALPAPAVVMRRFDVQPVLDSPLASIVVRRMAELLPGTLDGTVLDYQVLGPASSDGSVPVLAVAVRRDLVLSYTAAIRAAGLEPTLVDVDVFALDRLLRAGRREWPAAVAVALVHAGARSAAVSVLGADGPIPVADVPAGPEVGAEELASAVERALDLSWPEPAGSRRVRVVLSGGAAIDLAATLSRRLAIPIEVLDPFGSVVLGPRVDRALLASAGPAFAVAVGLALRRPEAHA
jgi:type IV pilus assembly protein PilM